MQKRSHSPKNHYNRYTQQEYFKRVLADEDDVASDKKDPWKESVKMSHDGTDFNVSSTKTGDFKVGKGQPSIVPSTSDPDVGFGTTKKDQLTLVVRDSKGQITKVKTK